MGLIYIGDSGRVAGRAGSDHCGGNVEGSAFRRHTAQAMNFSVERLGGYQITHPENGEDIVSAYIRSGCWHCLPCSDADEAEGFQFYLIQRLTPLLNVDHGDWLRGNEAHYQDLYNQWIHAPCLKCADQNRMPTGPGIYAFYHAHTPDEHVAFNMAGAEVPQPPPAQPAKPVPPPAPMPKAPNNPGAADGCSPPLNPETYGRDLYVVMRDVAEPTRIRIIVRHGNQGNRRLIAQHMNDGPYWLGRQAAFAGSNISAERWLAEIMTHYRDCFARNRITFELA